VKLTKTGEFSMNRQEVTEFSSWLNSHPQERYKCFNEVVQSFIEFKQNEHQINAWILEEAQ
jgi:hypothetical protein